MKRFHTAARLAVGMAIVAAASSVAVADQIHPSQQVTTAINTAIKNSGVQIAPSDPIQGKSDGRSDSNPKGK